MIGVGAYTPLVEPGHMLYNVTFQSIIWISLNLIFYVWNNLDDVFYSCTPCYPIHLDLAV